MSTQPTISYKPLTGGQDIRLIRLKAADADPSNEHVVCEIVHANRSEDIEYTALSYAWCDSTQRQLIVVDGVTAYISASLEVALRTLRDDTSDQLFWADQICINQQDDVEKSLQVQQMQETYSSASKVIAWLGPAADNSDLLIQRLCAIDDAINYSGKRHLRKELFSFYAESKELSSMQADFDSFCKRPYWKRLWVLQEFSLPEDLHIACGNTIVAADRIDWISCTLNDPLSFFCDADNKPPGVVELAKVYQSSALSFVCSLFTRRARHHGEDAETDNCLQNVLDSSLVLQSDYNHPECSDPRDRVFSLLGLADDRMMFDTFPDYSRACEEIYEELARKLLEQGRIDILAYCQFPRAARNRAMCTWAPDWCMPTRMPRIRTMRNYYAASGGTLPNQEILFPDSMSLSLKGVVVDTVHKIGTLWDPDWATHLDVSKTLRYLDDIETLCAKSPRMEEDEKALAASVIAIADGMYYPTEEMRSSTIQGLKTCGSEHVAATPETVVEKLQEAGTPFQSVVMYMEILKSLHSRRPFRSATGYVGLAPHHVARGDVVVVLLGGNTPYILRRKGGNTRNTYSLVGEAYVHGIMYGEAFQRKKKRRGKGKKVEIERFIIQ